MHLTVRTTERDRLRTGAATTSVLLLSVSLAVGALAPDLLRSTGPVLLVLAGLLGLPHGAVDHLAWGWSRGEVRARPGVVLVYATAAALAVVAAVSAPVPALLLLLALSAAHFAEGEVDWARQRGGAPGRWAGAATGLAVVTLPLLLRPGQTRPMLAALDPGLPDVLLGARLPLLLLTGAVVAVGLVTARHDPVRLGELALVLAVVVVLPPLAAFAAWFAGWHAVRHTARLVALDPRSRQEVHRGELGPPLRRFARAAAVPSAAALVGTGLLATVLGATGGLLVALLALTVPHAAVVARLGSPLSREPLSRVPGTPAGRSG